MLALNTILLIIAQMAGNATAEQVGEYVGLMPEIVVTAPRYQYEDDAWSGLIDTIVVTAPRHEVEDIYAEDMTADKNSNTIDPATALSRNESDNYWGQPLGIYPKEGVFMRDQELYD